MTTDWRARAQRFAVLGGIVWLAVLLYALCVETAIVVHDFGSLRSVGAATIADRSSQLKPLPWKAPWAEWAAATFLLVLIGCIAVSVVGAIRRAFSRQDRSP